MTKCCFDEGKSCSALKEKNCAGCAFYKTQEQRDLTQLKIDAGLYRTKVKKKYKNLTVKWKGEQL